MDEIVEAWMLNQAAYYVEYAHFDKAMAILLALQNIDDSNLNIYKMLSYVYLQTNHFKKAIDAANKFIVSAKNTNDIKKMEWLKKNALFKLKLQYKKNKTQEFRQHL